MLFNHNLSLHSHPSTVSTMVCMIPSQKGDLAAGKCTGLINNGFFLAHQNLGGILDPIKLEEEDGY